jgi:hypothetical protein
MKVTATKLTTEALMQAACSTTMRGKASKMTLDRIYSCMHSPIRTQIFWVEMVDIPTFVSVHFVRHSAGICHYVGTNREDRGGVAADRSAKINHSMLVNAEALINLSRKRLCGQASKETQEAMQAIKEAIALVDPYLPKYMQRECQFRNGKCPELKCCGNLWRPDEAH